MKQPNFNQNMSFYVILTGKTEIKLLLELYSILTEMLVENDGRLL